MGLGNNPISALWDRRKRPILTGAISSAGTSNIRNDFPDWLGFRFSLASNITIYELGRLKLSGDNQTHNVAVFDAITGVNLGQVSINAALGTINEYQYVELATTVVLIAGTNYIIATKEDSLDDWYNLHSVTPASGITVNSAVYYSGGWNVSGTNNVSYADPNLRFTTQVIIPSGFDNTQCVLWIDAANAKNTGNATPADGGYADYVVDAQSRTWQAPANDTSRPIYRATGANGSPSLENYAGSRHFRNATQFAISELYVVFKAPGTTWSTYGSMLGNVSGAASNRPSVLETGNTTFHNNPLPRYVLRNGAYITSAYSLSPINEWAVVTIGHNNPTASREYTTHNLELTYFASLNIAEIIGFSADQTGLNKLRTIQYLKNKYVI